MHIIYSSLKNIFLLNFFNYGCSYINGDGFNSDCLIGDGNNYWNGDGAGYGYSSGNGSDFGYVNIRVNHLILEEK